VEEQEGYGWGSLSGNNQVRQTRCGDGVGKSQHMGRACAVRADNFGRRCGDEAEPPSAMRQHERRGWRESL
jgi:hypothetical protein